MSFSNTAKEELLKAEPKKHCDNLAELFGIASFCVNADDASIYFVTESENIAKRLSYLIKRVFSVDNGNIEPARSGRGGKNTALKYSEKKDIDTLVLKLNIKSEQNRVQINVPIEIIKNPCCQKAFIKGAFLGGGYIMPPESCYHFEFTAKGRAALDTLSVIFDGFMLNPKIIKRSPYHVAYFKNADAIEEILAIIGANQSVMDFMNIRILKEKRNEINRRVNFETANLQKTTTAASKLLSDIETIMETVGLDAIGEELSQTALCRLANPDASLAELARLLGLSRSGVNHRLKKLSELAEELL